MTGTVSEAELADLIRRLSSEEDLSSLMLASSSSSISWSSSAMSSQTMVGWRFGGPIEVEEVEEGAEEAAEVAVVEFEDWQAAVFSCIWANLFVSSIEVLLAVTPLAVISLPQFICSEKWWWWWCIDPLPPVLLLAIVVAISVVFEDCEKKTLQSLKRRERS